MGGLAEHMMEGMAIKITQFLPETVAYLKVTDEHIPLEEGGFIMDLSLLKLECNIVIVIVSADHIKSFKKLMENIGIYEPDEIFGVCVLLPHEGKDRGSEIVQFLRLTNSQYYEESVVLRTVEGSAQKIVTALGQYKVKEPMFCAV